MLVRELIELLSEEDPEAEVHIAYNYGDHGRTTVAPAIRRVETERVVHSDYHDMDKVFEEDYDAKSKTIREVVIVRA